MLDANSIFSRYQSIRPRLPKATFTAATLDIESLLDIGNEVDAFVFDAFGVLNVGETPIPGAAARLKELRKGGHQIRILSNAASYNHQGATAKFQKLGMQVDADEIVTSRDAALANLNDGLWGCIASPSDDLTDILSETIRLEADQADFDRADGFLFLSTEIWQQSQQSMLCDSLLANPRPVVIANADLAAPRDFGFSLEPGHYGHLLADEGLQDIRFFGKPFPEVFEMVEATLPGVPPERIAMCGDTLHTDILGAAARGWSTVLVAQDGVFSGLDTRTFCEQSSLTPSWRLLRI
ncbi:HAD-IIA family hydrolase [Ruegeria atlantica]|uniref:HAD-IIA family hydrolase n=1 Tax=Ruegeria atlantica TaxID=81569 RepID=UPI00147EF2F8|nr:HAD-IIA family hydrolase [Ruegeria atlantica]